MRDSTAHLQINRQPSSGRLHNCINYAKMISPSKRLAITRRANLHNESSRLLSPCILKLILHSPSKKKPHRPISDLRIEAVDSLEGPSPRCLPKSSARARALTMHLVNFHKPATGARLRALGLAFERAPRFRATYATYKLGARKAAEKKRARSPLTMTFLRFLTDARAHSFAQCGLSNFSRQ